jgi:hypothetical protein
MVLRTWRISEIFTRKQFQKKKIGDQKLLLFLCFIVLIRK